MPSSNWSLALAELIYYTPTLLPALYCLTTHRRHGLTGWLFLTIFLVLQIVSAILTIAAGPNGNPPIIASILSGVGLSPLLLGVAGIIHEWADVCGLIAQKKKANAIAVLYHFVVVTGIAIYATGASSPSKPNSRVLSEAGIVLLLLCWAALIAVFTVLAKQTTTPRCRALFCAIAVSLALLAWRVVFAVVAAFARTKALNPVTESVVLKVFFQFVPGALIVGVMVVGGVMTRHEVEGVAEREHELATAKV